MTALRPMRPETYPAYLEAAVENFDELRLVNVVIPNVRGPLCRLHDLIICANNFRAET